MMTFQLEYLLNLRGNRVFSSNEYNRKESAINAFHNIYGRFFDGRTVIVKFYDERAYKEKDFYLPLE